MTVDKMTYDDLEKNEITFKEKYGEQLLKTAAIIDDMTADANKAHLVLYCAALTRFVGYASKNVERIEKQENSTGWSYDFGQTS